MLNEMYKEAMNNMLGERRKKILQLLTDKDVVLRVGEIAKEFDMSLPLVSFHINMLINYGLVKRQHSATGSVIGIEVTDKGKKLIREL